MANEKGQNRERPKEIYLNFQKKRLAALSEKFTVRQASLSLSSARSNSLHSLHPALRQQSTTTDAEKTWYYQHGFLDSLRFVKAIARNSPDGLPTFLGMKGGQR